MIWYQGEGDEGLEMDVEKRMMKDEVYYYLVEYNEVGINSGINAVYDEIAKKESQLCTIWSIIIPIM